MKLPLSINILLLCSVFTFDTAIAQKKPLDHSVYDGWQTLGEKKISNNGEWVAYTVEPQEGDGKLIVKNPSKSVSLEFERGYASSFTSNSHYLVFKVKPLFRDTREAKIKKRKTEDMPKDSLGILNLTSLEIEKIPTVSSYKITEKNNEWIAYLMAVNYADSSKPATKKDTVISKNPDTSKKKIPLIIEQTPDKKQKRKMTAKEGGDDDGSDAEINNDENASIKEGNDLIVQQLGQKDKRIFKWVSEYQWSENGKLLVVSSTASKKDKKVQPQVAVFRSAENRIDTILQGANTIKNLTVDKNGYQVAFLAERDSAFKSLQKFYKLYYWQNGDKNASVLADKFSVGMKINWTISEHFTPYFSKQGERLFFGTSPIQPIKDTSLVEIDLVKLDVWHYNDDYLQPYQLKNLDQENKRSYLAMFNLSSKQLIQLGDKDLPQVLVSNEGDGVQFLGITDKGRRISMQWEGSTNNDFYSINPSDGSRKLIVSNVDGQARLSPKGKFIYWYDMMAKSYFSYTDGKLKNISKSVPVKLYDEEYDMPSPPTPYGAVKWMENEEALWVYDRYDIWQLDAGGNSSPINITKGIGRKNQLRFRYVELDPDKKIGRAHV